jgi:hypothetical protein
MPIQSEITAFAQRQKEKGRYTGAEYFCEWRGYQVYEPIGRTWLRPKDRILVHGEAMRWTTEEEAFDFINEMGAPRDPDPADSADEPLNALVVIALSVWRFMRRRINPWG